MSQITARVPKSLVEQLDRAATSLHRSRADVIRQAIESYLADVEDLSPSLRVLQDPADPVLDWEDVRAELFEEPVSAG